MENTFIPKAVKIVQRAIDCDNLGDYEEAYRLYKR